MHQSADIRGKDDLQYDREGLAGTGVHASGNRERRTAAAGCADRDRSDQFYRRSDGGQ